MAAREGTARSLNKLYLALAGLATVAGHWVVSMTHDREAKTMIRGALSERLKELDKTSYEQRLVRERDFSRKADVERAFEKLAQRVDRGNDQLEDLVERVNQLEGYLKARDQQRTEETRTFWRRVKKIR